MHKAMDLPFPTCPMLSRRSSVYRFVPSLSLFFSCTSCDFFLSALCLKAKKVDLFPPVVTCCLPCLVLCRYITGNWANVLPQRWLAGFPCVLLTLKIATLGFAAVWSFVDIVRDVIGLLCSADPVTLRWYIQREIHQLTVYRCPASQSLGWPQYAEILETK